VITLGLGKSDNINRMITITDEKQVKKSLWDLILSKKSDNNIQHDNINRDYIKRPTLYLSSGAPADILYI